MIDLILLGCFFGLWIIINLFENMNTLDPLINSKFPKIEDYLYKINLKQDELLLSLFETRKKMNWIICEPNN